MTDLTAGIHVTRWGSEGPKVLLVHGGPQGSSLGGVGNFRYQEPLAERGWQLFVPDRPGHAATPSRGPEDMEVEGTWIAEMLDDEGMHLVGHSYGGLSVLCAAVKRPEAVKSLTLIEAPLFSAAEGDPVVEEARGHRNDDGELDPAAHLARFAGLVRIPFDQLEPKPTPEEMVALGEGLRTMTSPMSWDSSGHLEKLRESGIPVMAATGGWSENFDHIAQGLVEKVGAEHLVTDTDHHFAQFGPKFNDGLDAFMRKAEANPRG